MRRKTLAIVGGGYAGAELAKALATVMDVTLIERAERFTHAPAMIRGVVDPALLDKALIPYDNLLPQGRIVRGEAVAVDDGGVSLADGSRFAADYVVLATGSSNFAPLKSGSGDIGVLRADNARWHAALIAAQSVLIVGAGAVGTELAGEIADAHPDKTVTLVASDPELFPGTPGRLGRTLRSKLQLMGVTVITGARAQTLPGRDGPIGGRVTLSDGQEIEADLVIPAVGSRPNSALAANLPGAEVAADGRVKVDRWMRPSRLENVFALGDVADAGDAMTIVAVSRQAPWLTRTLKALARGKSLDDVKPYVPWRRAPILVPLGPRRGNTFLILATVGDQVTRAMKGKDLFIRKYRKLFGQA